MDKYKKIHKKENAIKKKQKKNEKNFFYYVTKKISLKYKKYE